MNRPPQPTDLLWYMKDGWAHNYCFLIPEMAEKYDSLEASCMQEALTAEWLIEQGFMPDPSSADFREEHNGSIWLDWDSPHADWVCEDKS